MDRRTRRELEELEERLMATEWRSGSGIEYAAIEKHTRQIKWLVAQIDALTAAVKKLEEQSERAYSENAETEKNLSIATADIERLEEKTGQLEDSITDLDNRVDYLETYQD